jgi:hypothetical protein
MAGEVALPPPLPVETRYYEPKILVIDIETAPILAYVWDLFDQNIPLDMIVEDWFILSFAAKWLGSPKEEVFYADIRETPKDDSGLCSQIWQLLDEADIVVGQNSKRFDEKKINARLLAHNFPPPADFRSADTLEMAKARFKFASNKLAYASDRFCVKYKKLDHGKYPGNKLFIECLKGNLDAWEECRIYNIFDVLATEEYYLRLRPYCNKINFNVFNRAMVCSCGSDKFRQHERPRFTNSGIFARYICESCGAPWVDKNNLLTKEDRFQLRELGL